METIARDPCVTFAELPEPHARPYKHDAPGLQICLRHTRAREHPTLVRQPSFTAKH